MGNDGGGSTWPALLTLVLVVEFGCLLAVGGVPVLRSTM
jgi:hypothetical protein